jgi:hypothetical protein
MALFLYKPHVVGPGNDITSPDVIVDRVFVDATAKPLDMLTSRIAHQIEDGDVAAAAYAVTAIGGGALLSPAILLGASRIVVARMAWRLRDLDGHIGELTLNGEALERIGLPAAAAARAGGDSQTRPRGIRVGRPAGRTKDSAELRDEKLDRSLVLRLSLENVNSDRWGSDRPEPRYSVGPTEKEVQHYI